MAHSQPIASTPATCLGAAVSSMRNFLLALRSSSGAVHHQVSILQNHNFFAAFFNVAQQRATTKLYWPGRCRESRESF